MVYFAPTWGMDERWCTVTSVGKSQFNQALFRAHTCHAPFPLANKSSTPTGTSRAGGGSPHQPGTPPATSPPVAHGPTKPARYTAKGAPQLPQPKTAASASTTRPYPGTGGRNLPSGQGRPASGGYGSTSGRPDSRSPGRTEVPDGLARAAERNDRIGDFVETRYAGGGAADPQKDTEAPGQPLRRLFASDYADNKSQPSGADRPSARAISNAVVDATGDKPNAAGASDLFWVWGQFLDHDLDLVKTGSDAFNVAIPAGDPDFDAGATGTGTIALRRSTGVDNPSGRREQINTISALIDAGNVYGTDAATAAKLRTGENGKLRTSDRDMLPTDAGFFLAGDERANENPGLTAMHTLFVREHNRIADEIAARDPGLGDEQIYTEARRLVTAELQAITVNEFLPLLLGRDALGDYKGYTGVDAQISNEFAAAAFRLGHTLVSDSLTFVDSSGATREVALSQAFFNPQLVNEVGIDSILRGLSGSSAQAIDTEIVDSLRNMVMPGPGAPRADLASLNIQRGRDHGLPTLNDAREALGMSRLSGFDDPRLRDGVGQRLASTYDSIDDVDLWVGLLAERPIGSSQIGPTQEAILIDQFRRLRDGDPNWYERTYDSATVAELDGLRLADVIKRNTGVTDIDRSAMIV